ncbi:MAG: hypothetical protein H6Q03_2307, partial [Acidobacteria bacterium]|nr:hypothetical protein [Acidobacteriota bacterium]
LRALGAEAATSPSVRRRLAFLVARAAAEAAEGRAVEARADLEAALALARQGQRKLTELELRLELAALEARFGPAAGAQAQSASDLEREARAVGYLALAERARALDRASRSARSL